VSIAHIIFRGNFDVDGNGESIWHIDINRVKGKLGITWLCLITFIDWYRSIIGLESPRCARTGGEDD